MPKRLFRAFFFAADLELIAENILLFNEVLLEYVVRLDKAKIFKLGTHLADLMQLGFILVVH